VIVLWVALAGSAGAVTRFLVDGAVRGRCVTNFPFGTLLINVSGSALLGVLTGLVLHHGQPTALTTITGNGFCGGYTTFSTASFETVRLLQEQRHRAAALNAVANLLLTLGAAELGLLIAG